MDWSAYIEEYKIFLRIEKSLSEHSVTAYLGDLDKLMTFLETNGYDIRPEEVDYALLRAFLNWVNGLGIGTRSQARLISGLKSFYKYLLISEKAQVNPTELLESPRLGRKLPEVLSVEEIDRIVAAIDL
ncbi:MAG: site-specific integrase, partial [Bacteroidales bacterium]|nr:site-specific integrase [Bacteroidales bacterium]